MHEIRKGLEAGVDVSVYANPKYNDLQMSEIREKLEEELKAKNNTLIPKEDEKMSL